MQNTNFYRYKHHNLSFWFYFQSNSRHFHSMNYLFSSPSSIIFMAWITLFILWISLSLWNFIWQNCWSLLYSDEHFFSSYCLFNYQSSESSNGNKSLILKRWLNFTKSFFSSSLFDRFIREKDKFLHLTMWPICIIKQTKPSISTVVLLFIY